VVNATIDLNGSTIHCTVGRSSPTALSSTLVASIHINTPNLSMFFIVDHYFVLVTIVILEYNYYNYHSLFR
jgi:hypothetical protein